MLESDKWDAQTASDPSTDDEVLSRSNSASSLESLSSLFPPTTPTESVWTMRPKARSPDAMLAAAGWSLLLAVWIGLAAAVRAPEATAASLPSFEVAFSGWTAVVATAVGGLPLMFARPEVTTCRLVGVANGIAAGMMIGASAGMLVGLVHELPASGVTVPLAGIVAGVLSVRAVGSLGACSGSNRVAMVTLAFAADAFAEGLALGAAAGGGSTMLVTAALVVHNLPEGLAVAAPLILQQDGRSLSPAAACLLAACTSLPQPLVGLAALHLLQAGIHPLVPCVLTAVSVGAVAWVGLADLFREAAESLGQRGALAVVAPTTGLMLLHHVLTEV